MSALGDYEFVKQDSLGSETPILADMIATYADQAIAELKAALNALQVCGNCRHWWSGLMGCGMDSAQEVTCEGFDHCKVFNQAVGGPREACWAPRERGKG